MHAEHEEVEYLRRLDVGLWRWILRRARPQAHTIAGMCVLGLVMAACDLSLPLLTRGAIDRAVAISAGGGAIDTVFGVPRGLLAPVGMYFGVIVLMAVLIKMFITLAGVAATGLERHLRGACFDKLQVLPFAFYDQRPVGWLIARVTADCTRLMKLLPWLMLDLCWGFTLLGSIAVTMLILDWRLALIVLLVVPPLALISAFFQVRLLRTSRQMSRTNSRITSAFNEEIMGVRTTKSLVREEHNLAEFSELAGTMQGWACSNAILSTTYLPLVMVISTLGMALALVGGGTGVLAGDVTIGTLVAFMQFAALFFLPIEELARRFSDVQSAQSWAERLRTLLEAEVTIRDSDAVTARIAEHAAVAKTSGVGGAAFDGGSPTIDHVEFRNVSFAYGNGPPVLSDISFRVESGQNVALVGATGGGKSTIVSLLCRFYEPTKGAILLDGVEYRERSLDWLQSNLGIVQQVPHLFSGTVRDNIRYGRLHATDEEVMHAARTVNAHEVISRLDQGYDTEVGEGGSRLSTGQRQLVALARAVLADPAIFILDEATSSVDTETERLIQGGIDRILAGRIPFVIAHRLSTIRNADLILVIDGGRIIEAGTHQALMSRRGRYHELHRHQVQAAAERTVLGA